MMETPNYRFVGGQTTGGQNLPSIQKMGEKRCLLLESEGYRHAMAGVEMAYRSLKFLSFFVFVGAQIGIIRSPTAGTLKDSIKWACKPVSSVALTIKGLRYHLNPRHDSDEPGFSTHYLKGVCPLFMMATGLGRLGGWIFNLTGAPFNHLAKSIVGSIGTAGAFHSLTLMTINYTWARTTANELKGREMSDPIAEQQRKAVIKDREKQLSGHALDIARYGSDYLKGVMPDGLELAGIPIADAWEITGLFGLIKNLTSQA